MSTLAYRLVNVFTRDGAALSGNPLCVFEQGAQLTAESMQALARQFNLSETTFLLPPTQPGAHARVRIFTPSYEMPFAGHPTLGSAAVCRSLGLGGEALKLEMTAGIIPVSHRGNRWALSIRLRGSREVPLPRGQLAAGLGLAVEDLAERPLWVQTGKEQLIVPLASTAAVERAAARPELFEALVSEDGSSMAYVFALEGPDTVRARFFFPQGHSVLEDPATGSAAANLGGWWQAMGRPLPCSLTIQQGERVNRPSRLFVQISQETIEVAGEVIELGRGVVSL